MSNNLLLPHKYKLIGWCLLIPTTILGIVLSLTNFEAFPIKTKVFAIFNGGFPEGNQSFEFVEGNITPTLVGVLFIVGGILVSFSKEKREDEFISKLRLNSLLWAVLVNYILLLLCFVFIYGFAFLDVMLYNMFTVLIIFIVRFNYILYTNSKTVSDEK